MSLGSNLRLMCKFWLADLSSFLQNSEYPKVECWRNNRKKRNKENTRKKVGDMRRVME